jgi:hypothetical protein
LPRLLMSFTPLDLALEDAISLLLTTPEGSDTVNHSNTNHSPLRTHLVQPVPKGTFSESSLRGFRGAEQIWTPKSFQMAVNPRVGQLALTFAF